MKFIIIKNTLLLGVLLKILACTGPDGVSDAYKAGLKAYENKHYQEALSIWSPLAKRGNRLAQYEIGNMYYNAQGVKQSYQQAAYWYERAAIQGDAKAQASLGAMYRMGIGLRSPSPPPTGATIIGNLLLQKDKSNPRYVTAVKWLRLSAKQGNASGQINLGMMYELGKGVGFDDKAAVYWYRKAAVQEMPEAQNALARMYINGDGVAQNYDQAARWLCKAVALGYKDSISTLSLIKRKCQ